MSTKKNYRISNWWWENLSLNDKIKYKGVHEIAQKDSAFVNLINTIGTRISKLTESQISSIHKTSDTFYDTIDEFWKVYDFEKSTYKKLIKK